MLIRDIELSVLIEAKCRCIKKTISDMKSCDDEMSDFVYKSIAMDIIQICEYSKHLSKGMKEVMGNKVNWGRLREIRNNLAHGFDNIPREYIMDFANIEIEKIYEFVSDTNRKNEEDLDYVRKGGSDDDYEKHKKEWEIHGYNKS